MNHNWFASTWFEVLFMCFHIIVMYISASLTASRDSELLVTALKFAERKGTGWLFPATRHLICQSLWSCWKGTQLACFCLYETKEAICREVLRYQSLNKLCQRNTSRSIDYFTFFKPLSSPFLLDNVNLTYVIWQPSLLFYLYFPMFPFCGCPLMHFPVCGIFPDIFSHLDLNLALQNLPFN